MFWNQAGVRIFLVKVYIFTGLLKRYFYRKIGKPVWAKKIFYIEKRGDSVKSIECFFVCNEFFWMQKKKIFRKSFSENFPNQGKYLRRFPFFA